MRGMTGNCQRDPRHSLAPIRALQAERKRH